MRAEMGPSRGATMTAARPAASISRGSREGGLSRFAISAKIDAPKRSAGGGFSSRNLSEFRHSAPRVDRQPSHKYNHANTRPLTLGIPMRSAERATKPFALTKNREGTFNRPQLNRTFRYDSNRKNFDAKFAHVLQSQNPSDKIKITTENKKTWLTSKPIDYKKDFSKIQRIERVIKSPKLAEIKPSQGYYRRAELKTHQFSTQKDILTTRLRMSKPERAKVATLRHPGRVQDLSRSNVLPLAILDTARMTRRNNFPKHKVEIIPKVNEQPQIRQFKAAEVQKLSKQTRYEAFTPLSFRAKNESRNLIPQKQLSGVRSLNSAIAPFEMTASNAAAHMNKSDLARAQRVVEAYTKLGLTKNEAQVKVLQTKTKEKEIFLAKKKEEEQRPIICFVESLQKLPSIKTTEEQKESKGILGRYIDPKDPQKKSEKIVLGTATPIGAHSSNSEGNHNAEICADCIKMAQKKHFTLSV